MKYPTLEQCEKLHLSPPDLNSFIDNVLQSVYDFSNNRSLIFSSFNPQVCTIMNWKQPNYGVFYRTYCGFDSDTHEPIKSIKSSIKFCKGCDLLGVVCDARAFSLCPELIQTVKESGLLFVTFGDGDMDTLVENGVDAVIQNGVFQYKTQ
jgi:glycerophosphoryl diester phosphodiesterase